MSRKEIIKYIRDYDKSFINAHLENYPFHELMLIKISIDVEIEQSRMNGPGSIKQSGKLAQV